MARTVWPGGSWRRSNRAASIRRHPGPRIWHPVDEFHIGGRPATLHFAEMLGFQAGGRLLDLGCGLGGAARFIAGAYGCHVTGLDLTPGYIEVARLLSERSSTEAVAFEVGSALETPFQAEAFDGAYTIHVAMNIRDRAGLYREAARVLKAWCRLRRLRRDEGAR